MFNVVKCVQSRLLQSVTHDVQQHRTTFILKRRWPVFLHKKGKAPRRIKAKDLVYDVVEHKDSQKKPNIDMLLVNYVEGLGQAGDKVSVRPSYAYEGLLLPGLAVHPTEENILKYANLDRSKHSSKYAERTVNVLSHRVLAILMNKDEPWTLQPWHIRVALRKTGIVAPEEAITMPAHEIKGPDLELEKKEFPIKVTINNLETVYVRCRIHHWSTNIDGRLPYAHDHWREPRESLFPEDEALLDSMPGIFVKQKKPSVIQR